MKTVLAVALSFTLITAADGKDYYIHLSKGANLVLTEDRCDMEQITGIGWQRSEVQYTAAGPRGVMTLDPGCWKRFGDKVYVLDEVTPFWIAPDQTGGDTYYRLDTRPCAFEVPGISFAGWRSGRQIAVLEQLPKDGPRKVPTVDNGPMCWRYDDSNWFEQVDQPELYSALEAKASPLP